MAARRESFQASTSYGAIQITPPRTARGLVVPYVQPTRQAPMPTPPMPPPVPGAHAPKAPTSRLSAAEAEVAARALLSTEGMKKAEASGVHLNDEAVEMLLTLPPQHASALLTFCAQKHGTSKLVDPSGYVVATIKKGYVPR